MSKKFLFSISSVLVLALTFTTYGAPGQIWLDFDHAADVNTHPGCTSFLISNSGSTVNGITIDLFGELSSARRPEPNNPGEEVTYGDNIYRDFIYGLGTSPVNITLWELGAGQNCSITLWSFDNNSDPARIADWYSNGAYIFTTNFAAGQWPWCIENPCLDGPSHAYDAVVTADAFGRIKLTNVMDPNSGTPFAFINALRVVPGTYTSASTYAHRPLPYDGEINVSVKTNLKWRNGAAADNKRDVYLGTSFNDVNTATRASHPGVLLSQAQGPNNLDPYGATGFLKLDTTCYWRVDEVIGGTPQKGEVWSFKTEPYHVMEDWDSYATTDDLRPVWQDGIYPQDDPITSMDCFVEATVVHAGQSMKCNFRNFDLDPYYSEVRADTADTAVPPERNGLGMDPNWQGMDAASLSLWFRGDANNPVTEPMYIILKDGAAQTATVTYPDTNDLKVQTWQEWNIPLSNFTSANPSLNLKNISRIIIRFGDPPQGNAGIVYLDDLRLYSVRCVLAERNPDITAVDYAPSGITPGDCVVDHQELEVMADTWLSADEVIPTKNPGDGNLVLYYPLNEGDGNMVYPAAGSGGDAGSLDPWTGTTWNATQSRNSVDLISTDHAPGIGGTGCAYVDGQEGCRINCGTMGQAGLGIGPNPDDTNAITTSVWIKSLGTRYWNGYLREKAMGVLGKRGGWSQNSVVWMFGLTADGKQLIHSSFSSFCYSPAVVDTYTGQWIHVAASYPHHSDEYPADANSYTWLFLNGSRIHSQIYHFTYGDDPNILLSIGNMMDEAAWPASPEGFWGYIDEVRIYNRALEPNEIAYLADPTPDDGVLQIPIPSLAEIYSEEPEGQRAVNFRDFAMLANLWLEEDMYP
jgi:hypothetical protein